MPHLCDGPGILPTRPRQGQVVGILQSPGPLRRPSSVGDAAGLWPEGRPGLRCLVPSEVRALLVSGASSRHRGALHLSILRTKGADLRPKLPLGGETRQAAVPASAHQERSPQFYFGSRDHVGSSRHDVSGPGTLGKPRQCLRMNILEKKVLMQNWMRTGPGKSGKVIAAACD
jgi:hypothetical protein